jgi:Ion channel
MSTAAGVVLTAAGAALIVGVLRDAFEALFHPDGRMALSRGVMRGVWWLFHRAVARRPALFPLAGPAMLLTILMLWAALLAVGWAFVLWPHFPDGFRFATELGPPGDQRGFVDAVYMSLVTLGTIGYGDISPASDLLRLLVPLEALVGFALLTASVSWLLTVYPALSRRRSLAYEITLLREVTRRSGRGEFVRGQARSAERLYAELLSRLVAVERDLVAIPVSYYFTERDDRFSLPYVMPWLLGMAQRGLADDVSAPTRLRAEMLCAAIDDFARTTAERFHGEVDAPTAVLLERYASDHLRDAREARSSVRASTVEVGQPACCDCERAGATEDVTQA